MRNIITIKDLTFQYNSRLLFDKFNLNIKEGEWLSLVGPNGSGKSTLVKILVGLLEAKGNIVIDDVPLTSKNIMSIRAKMGIVFENADDSFVSETVEDDLAFALENLNYNKKEMKAMILKIAHTFGIENLLTREPHLLSGGERQKVALAAALVTSPKILIIDDALEMIDPLAKKDILKILTTLHKEGLTIISITQNLAETYHANRLVVIEHGEILIEGPLKKVLTEDKIFNRIGIEVPFMVDLSNKLKLYGLVDHIILDMNEMVNVLWK